MVHGVLHYWSIPESMWLNRQAVKREYTDTYIHVTLNVTILKSNQIITSVNLTFITLCIF